MDKFHAYYTKIKSSLTSLYTKTLSAFISTLFPTKVSILFLGIDNAGKTTLLNLLKDTQTATKPTNHPTSTEIEIGNLTANIFDLGGHEPARMIWEKFFYSCDGVVFIIDAMDCERFLAVRQAYESVVRSIHLKKNVPISVLINKMDKVYEQHGDFADNHVRSVLEICGVEEKENVKVSCVSMLGKETDKSIYESFVWLENMIKTTKK